MSATRLACVLLACAAVGCAEKRSVRCAEVCTRERDCGDEREVEPRPDRGECIRQCNELERTADGRELVAAHARCVRQAADCAAVLACP